MINPRDERPSQHVISVGITGSGKSQIFKNHPLVKKKNVRLIAWDPNVDHTGIHYRTRLGFLKALKAAILADAKNKKGFRICYVPQVQCEKEWEWFMGLVLSILDGNKELVVIGEELSAVCNTTTKASPNAAVFMNQSRKYGAIFLGATQRAEEVAKTYYTQCKYKYVGQQSTISQLKKMSEMISVPIEKLKELQPLEFYKYDGSNNPAELIKTKFVKKRGISFGEE